MGTYLPWDVACLIYTVDLLLHMAWRTGPDVQSGPADGSPVPLVITEYVTINHDLYIVSY